MGRLCIKKLKKTARHRGLTPVILATQEAQIRRLMVQTQPGQIVLKTLPQKTHRKKGWLMAQGVGPEFKSQDCKKKKKKENQAWEERIGEGVVEGSE
jgi:hypothetical protein